MSFPDGYDKIKLIKIVRERTRCGLREAKDAVEEAEGDLELAIRLISLNCRFSHRNGQTVPCDKKSVSFTLDEEKAIICLHEAKAKGACNSCRKQDKLLRADIIVANGHVGSAYVCSRCVRVVCINIDLIAAFIGNGKSPEAGS